MQCITMHTFMHIYIYNIHRVQLYASNSYTQSHAHTYTLTHMHIIHILTYTCTQAHTVTADKHNA